MITNEEIAVVEQQLAQKIAEMDTKRNIINKCNQKLRLIKLQGRAEEVAAIESKEVMADDPDNPDGPQIMTTIPAVPATTQTIYDVSPKGELSEVTLGEPLRLKVLNAVKAKLANL